MQKRPIANTSLEISPIGLGTVKLGRDKGVKYPNDFTIPDDDSTRSLIDYAKDLGINLIDTAPAYGNSEERLGKLLTQREDWVICSKVGEDFDGENSTYNFTPEHAETSLLRSLKRLNTDYIDIVLIHSDGDDLNIINNFGLLDFLALQKKKGLIRSFGMSTKTVDGGILAAEKSDIVMVTYNLLEQSEKEVLNYCAQHNKTSLIKKAFASGHLNKVTGGDATQKDPVQASMDLIFSHPGATSVITGTINPAHLKDSVEKATIAIEKNG